MAYPIFRQVFGPLVRHKVRNITGQEHIPEQPPYIVAANHIGFLDGPALLLSVYQISRRPLYVLTRDFFWRILGGPLASRMLAMIPVYPQHKAAALDQAVVKLRQGHAVCIFPEGTRNPSANLQRGKTGAIRLALQSGAPIIPAGIINTTGRTFWQVLGSLLKHDAYIEVHFGPPIDLTPYRGQPVTKTLLHQATRDLMRSISSLSSKPYRY